MEPLQRAKNCYEEVVLKEKRRATGTEEEKIGRGGNEAVRH